MALKRTSLPVPRIAQKLFIVSASLTIILNAVFIIIQAVYASISNSSVSFDPWAIYYGINILASFAVFALAYFLIPGKNDRLWRIFLAIMYTQVYVMVQGLAMAGLFAIASKYNILALYVSWPQLLPALIASIGILAVLLFVRRSAAKPPAKQSNIVIGLLAAIYSALVLQQIIGIAETLLRSNRSDINNTVLIFSVIVLVATTAGILFTYFIQSPKTKRPYRIIRALLYPLITGLILITVSTVLVSLPALIQRDIPGIFDIQTPVMVAIVIAGVVTLVGLRYRKLI